MPSPNFLVRNWKKQLQLVLVNLAILRKNIDGKAVHDLRVAIKKLRSYSNLYAIICDQPDWKNDFSETEKLFSQLGRQRDIQNSFLLIEKLEEENISDYSLFKRHLRMMLDELSLRVRQSLLLYEEKELHELYKLIHARMLLIPNDQLAGQLLENFRGQLKKLKRHQKDFETQAHEARKSLKDLYYWVAITPARFIPNLQLKKIEKTLDVLGKWQDQTVLRLKTRHFRKDYLAKSDEEFSNLANLEKLLAEKNSILVKDANERLKLLKDNLQD